MTDNDTNALHTPSTLTDIHPDDISVVIPVLNAEEYIDPLLGAIFSQKPCPPGEVILVDSNSTDNTVKIAHRHQLVKIIPISNFSHGRGRNVGVRAAKGKFVVLLTQDALPANATWLLKLLSPIQKDTTVAATFSRQVPRKNASPMEQYFLQTHFPKTTYTQENKHPDKPLAFQQDVFFSNVSGAIRRSVLLENPFQEDLIMSEDQQFARDILLKNHKITYCPESIVIHSHNYTLRSVFKRYFDSVYSLTQLFQHGIGNSASMGLSYLMREAAYMIRHHPLWLPYYFCYTVAKSSGTVAGHFAEKMPKWMLKKLSMHSYHWQQVQTKAKDTKEVN